MSELSVNISKTINAGIESVFDAWLDPALLAQFILPSMGMAPPLVENDAREGGRFSILMQVGDEKIPHTGTYIALQRPHRLAFSWESPCSADDSIVTLVFSEVDTQSTLVELTHVRFVNEELRADHQGGWSNILEKLGELFVAAPRKSA